MKIKKVIKKMFISRDEAIKISEIKLAIHNEIYHSLNEEIFKNCGKYLPLPYMYYIEFIIDSKEMHKWLNINKRFYNV